jgi:hypothetical protein
VALALSPSTSTIMLRISGTGWGLPFIGVIFASISALLLSELRTVYSSLSGWPSRTSKLPSGRNSDAMFSGRSDRMNFA